MNEEYFTEQDRKFVNKVAEELIEKAQKLKKLSESDDYYGIWLTSIALDSLIDSLNNFVEEKRKQKSKEEVSR